MRPVFVSQEAFSNTYNSDLSHFFSGNTIKIRCIIDTLKVNPDSHIVISDCDLIVSHSLQLRTYLEFYMTNDITFMQDNVHDTTMNVGFGLIRSTPQTIRFFEDVLAEIIQTNGQDQTIVNSLILSFTGSYGRFSIPEIIQSNMYDLSNGLNNFYVLQLLCSNQNTYEKNLFEKLITAALLLDISDLYSLIPPDVFETLRWYFQQKFPMHYLSKI